MLAGEAPGCCELGVKGDSGWSSNTRMLVGMQTAKARLWRFQMGMETALETGLETTCVTFWQEAYLHFAHVL